MTGRIVPPRRGERSSSMDDSGLDHRFDSGKGYKTKQSELDDVERYVAGCMLLRHVARGEREQARKLCTDDARLVNYRDYDRRTVLHLAASEGRLGILEDLLNAGARANGSDRWGGSPLDDALRHRHHAVASELRKRGARLGAGLCGNQPVRRVHNSSLSHFSAMTRPSWLGRAVRIRHRHAIEQA